MSASDKLRALEEQTRADEDAMGELSVYAPWLLDAFPQIRALVEAAEETDRAWFGGWVRDALKGSMRSQRAALSALDEALP